MSAAFALLVALWVLVFLAIPRTTLGLTTLVFLLTDASFTLA